MPTTTLYGGFTVPILGDTDDVPSAVSTYADQIEPWLVKSFANAAARTAALTAAGLGSGVRGMVTWLDSPGRHERYDGTQWLPLVPVKQYIGVPLTGTTYDGVSEIITQRFTAVVTTNSAGGFSTGYVTPFPNAVMSVSFAVGSSAGGLAMVQALPENHTLTQCQGIALNTSGAAINTGGVRVEVDAVGW